MKLRERLAHAWDAFRSSDHSYRHDYGISYGARPDRSRLSLGNERSIIASLYNRIAIDVSAITIQHVRLDENGRFLETIKSRMNECLTVSANIDQTARAFMQDVVISLFDEGCVAIVPVETDDSPIQGNSYDIISWRTGQVLEWFPEHVRVRVYNDKKGIREDIILPKKMVAIIENPLYAVMNEPNSTLSRLIRKLNLLDNIDENNSSAKLDLIIQLPYIVKSEARKQQAEQRRKDIEMQLTSSQYGIAYTDGTERITQLNRAVESNLMPEIEYLTKMLYSQLGIDETVLNGTADEKTMLNYHNRTVEPVISAITDSMRRTFLTKTARTQGQSIIFFRDPFRLVPVNELADIADRFTRNEILSSNEVRAIIGYKPVDTQRAEELSNKNIAQEGEEMLPEDGGMTEADFQEGFAQLDQADAEIDELEGSM